MDVLSYTDGFGRNRQAVIRSLFHNGQGETFAVIDHFRSTYDVGAPYTVLRVGAAMVGSRINGMETRRYIAA